MEEKKADSDREILVSQPLNRERSFMIPIGEVAEDLVRRTMSAENAYKKTLEGRSKQQRGRALTNLNLVSGYVRDHYAVNREAYKQAALEDARQQGIKTVKYPDQPKDSYERGRPKRRQYRSPNKKI